MACSKSIYQPRPSVILIGLFLAVSFGTSLLVQGSPLPEKGVEGHFNDGVKAADDFINRAKNQWNGTTPGLTDLELAAIIAGAIILGFIVFCCIGYCLCECVKELICCICCCKCCRN